MSEQKWFWSDIGQITKKMSHFLLWQNLIANSLNLHFAIKFTRHSSILFNVAPEWLYIHTCLVTYIYILWRIYVRPNLVVLVFVRPNSSYVRPKLKVIGQMSCQVKYLFAAMGVSVWRLSNFRPEMRSSELQKYKKFLQKHPDGNFLLWTWRCNDNECIHWK
jgi:hypothetical protein